MREEIMDGKIREFIFYQNTVAHKLNEYRVIDD